MRYGIGILLLIIATYGITDLALKIRYTRKRLSTKIEMRKKNKYMHS